MRNIKIKDIAKEERPRERFLKVGVENLSNEELLSIILKTGTKEENVKQLALKIINKYENIKNLKNAKVNSLIEIKGIGKVKAIELLSSIELGKRIFFDNDKNNIILNNSKKVYDYFKNIFINEYQENFYAVFLDVKSKLINYRLLFKGTINMSIVHPREIFKYAFLENASRIIVIHNHPSNDVSPSIQDIELTNSLFEIGKIIKVPVIDHIIIGRTNYYSFYENMNK